MKKITELREKRWRTVHHRDAYGNLVKDTEDYEAKRSVKVISTGIKLVHFIVDLFCFQILIYIIKYFIDLGMLYTGFNETISLTFGLIMTLILVLLYPGLYTFCEYNWQRTPAKYLTKSIVIDEYGNKPDLRTIMLRSIIRFVPFEPFSCAGTPSSGWHDRWSKTWVVSEEELAELKLIQAEQSNPTQK